MLHPYDKFESNGTGTHGDIAFQMTSMEVNVKNHMLNEEAFFNV